MKKSREERLKSGELIDGEKVYQEDLKIIGPKVSKGFFLKLEEKKVSIKEVSNQSKVPEDRLKSILDAKSVFGVTEAKKVAKVLGCTPHDLILGIE